VCASSCLAADCGFRDRCHAQAYSARVLAASRRRAARDGRPAWPATGSRPLRRTLTRVPQKVRLCAAGAACASRLMARGSRPDVHSTPTLDWHPRRGCEGTACVLTHCSGSGCANAPHSPAALPCPGSGCANAPHSPAALLVAPLPYALPQHSAGDEYVATAGWERRPVGARSASTRTSRLRHGGGRAHLSGATPRPLTGGAHLRGPNQSPPRARSGRPPRCPPPPPHGGAAGRGAHRPRGVDRGLSACERPSAPLVSAGTSRAPPADAWSAPGRPQQPSSRERASRTWLRAGPVPGTGETRRSPTMTTTT